MIASKLLAKISPCITILRPDVFSPRRGMVHPFTLRHPFQLDRLYFFSCGIGALPKAELCVAAYFWRCWAVQQAKMADPVPPSSRTPISGVKNERIRAEESNSRRGKPRSKRRFYLAFTLTKSSKDRASSVLGSVTFFH